MRALAILGVCAALAACAPGPIAPTRVSGDNIVTQHGTARGADAFDGAAAYCSQRGKDVRMVSSECPGWCTTIFQCVTRG